MDFPPSKKIEFKFFLLHPNFTIVYKTLQPPSLPKKKKKSLNICVKFYSIFRHPSSPLSINFQLVESIGWNCMHHAKCTKQDHRAAIEVEACCIGKRISLLRVANCKRGCWSSWNTVVSRRLLLQARQGEQRILGEFSPVTPWPPTRFQRVPFCPLLLFNPLRGR